MAIKLQKKEDKLLKSQFHFLNNFLNIKNLDEQLQLTALLVRYNNRRDNDKYDLRELQDFISYHISMLINFKDWMTGIGLIDAMDAVIKASKEDGRLKIL
ncbi:MAG: hypothetical protein M0R03_16730 [Novosphingobium sp.]|nr:hypothetical protein [Novosphingobium sp.]